MQRLLAMVCTICPCCLAARMWPRSIVRRMVASYERYCPFCRARRALADKTGGEEVGSKVTDGVLLFLWALLLAGTVAAVVWMAGQR